jgi:uncharacterized protein YwgA
MTPMEPSKKKTEETKFEEALFEALKTNGHLFPNTIKDVEKLEELYGDTEIEMPSHLATFDDLLNSHDRAEFEPNLSLGIAAFTSEPEIHFQYDSKNKAQEDKSFKPGRIDFYKRILLAAEIVHQLHMEPTLGHLKVQKLIYLCQETSKMSLPTNFSKQAAGPYDNNMARSLDKKLLEKKWFKYQKDEFLKYLPLENAGEHLSDFRKFFINEIDDIHFIINTFRKAKSEQIELVGTIYACWKEAISKNEIPSIDLLSHKVYAWSEQKKKFSKQRIKKAVEWMTEKGIYPEN